MDMLGLSAFLVFILYHTGKGFDWDFLQGRLLYQAGTDGEAAFKLLFYRMTSPHAGRRYLPAGDRSQPGI